MRRERMKTAIIWLDPEIGCYRIRFSFSPEFVAVLKHTVPTIKHRCHDEVKTWSFSSEYLGAVLDEARKQFAEQNVRAPSRKKTSCRRDATSWHADRLFRMGGPERPTVNLLKDPTVRHD